MRMVMYSPDSIGLGHMRRNATIATEVVRQQPGASVALLIGSGAGAFFAVPKGVDTIKLPSVQKLATETWESRSLNISAAEAGAVRAGIIRNVITTLRPDVLLVDHLPMGVCGDLAPALAMIRAERLSTRVVLGLRDILDEPAIIRRRWTSQGTYDFIAEHYDAALIYGEREAYPSGELYGLEGCLRGRVGYAGYVCSALESARDTRSELDKVRTLAGLDGWAPGERIVIAAGGGGFDAYPMLSATLAALERLDGDPSVRAGVIAGPLMPEPDRIRLEAAARRLRHTTLVAWTADAMDYLAAADVAVVMAGYNSSLEALATRAHVVMMPRPGPSGEQRIRARMLAEKGLVDCIEAADASAERVEQAIRSALSATPRQPLDASGGGAARAARSLIETATWPLPRLRPPAEQPLRSRYVVF